MAITFLEERKIQKRFIWIFGVIILISFLIIWQGFFTKEKTIPSGEISKPAKKIEIDFDIFKNSVFIALEPFEEIKAIGEKIEVGREDPFAPYPPALPSVNE